MANDTEDLTANQVLCRIIGVGQLEADIMLSNVSAQDRAAIVEHYEADDIDAIHAILNKTTDE